MEWINTSTITNEESSIVSPLSSTCIYRTCSNLTCRTLTCLIYGGN